MLSLSPQEAPNQSLSLARAIVVSNQDPKGLGRIKIKYPWSGSSTQNSPSQWARVLTPFASQNVGWICLPNAEDEVFVYFENGNMDTPIVLGSLYSQKNPPPEFQNSKESPGKAFVLKTHGNHTISSNDTSEQDGITIQTNKGKKVSLSDSKSEVIISDEKENRLHITSDGVKVQDQHGNEVTLGPGGITIQSSKKIEIGEGASEALVKGKTFVKLFNSHIHNHPLGPTSPPAVPLQAKAVLSEKVKTI